MTPLKLLLHLPAALARDLWAWVCEDVPCRWANQTADEDTP